MNDLHIFLGLIALFYIVVIVMRLSGAMRKRRCPQCSHKLQRRNKAIGDYFIKGLMLNILPFNRYICTHCSWEGLRWNTKKRREERIKRSDEKREAREKDFILTD